MGMVYFGDIAEERRETIKTKPENCPIVGLEHITPGDIRLSDWDTGVENTFTKAFRKGDILFGRRRAYLKKAAVAPFDGICSGDITTIKAKEDKILPELLPFIVQNDAFFDFAVGKSAGSLSPRVKWEHLKTYQLNLPSMEEQKRLAKILMAAEETRQAYKKLIKQMDGLIKAKFTEMFACNSNWEKRPIIDIVEKPISGEWGTEAKYGEGVKVLRTTNFTDEGFINYDEVVNRKIDTNKVERKCLQKGDIIIEKSGGSGTKPVGRVVYYEGTTECYLVNNFTAILRNKSKDVLSRYLFFALYNAYFEGKTRLYEHKTTGIHNLKMQEYLSEFRIVIPPLELQEQFIEFLQQAEQTKLATQQSLNALNETVRALVNRNFN